MTRTKEAVIELFVDEGTICTAWDKDVYNGFADGEPPELDDEVFSTSRCLEFVAPNHADAEYYAMKREEERGAFLEVLGWLWRHGYRSVEWGTREIFDGKPSWAKRDKYVWAQE